MASDGEVTMPIVATCPCGEKFAIAASFPRKVACHRCGARTIVYNATETEATGWQLGESEALPQPRDDQGKSGGLKCWLCPSPCSAACARCGRFYCSRHGRARLNGVSTCVDCYDRMRPAFFIVGVLIILAGIAVGLIALLAPEPNEPKFPYYGIFLPMAGGILAAAAGQLWYACRSYP
jgi:hypothetical protein